MDAELTTESLGAAGDPAYEIGCYALTGESESGEPETMTGKFIVVWKRGSDGSSRIHAHIWNSDAPEDESDLD